MRQRLVVEPLVVDRAHFIDVLTSRFPEIDRGSGWALDLSCGTQGMAGDTQDQLEARGYSWVGVDVDLGRASVLADSHSLPFADNSFDLVVSVAALEHMRRPWRAARELGRVARPASLFCGTVAFMEPEHSDSYFHMSHRGIESLPEGAGFEPIYTWPGWHVFEAIAWFNFVERAGRTPVLYRPAAWLARATARVTHRLHDSRDGFGVRDRTEHSLDRLRFSPAIGLAARRI